MNNQKEWYEQFTRFFLKYFIIGLILIIMSVIYKNGCRVYITISFWVSFLDILFSIVDVLGPALLVGSFFSFSIESKSFIEYIKENIERVMIKKEFLDKLNSIDKKDALRRILSPDEKQFKIFSNIKNYFEETIEKDMILFDYNFKSHFTIDVNAKIRDSRVCLEETINHRIYKGQNGFIPIKVGFEKPDSVLISAEYILPNGEKQKVTSDDFIIEKQVEESGFTWNLYVYNIPSSIIADYITVNIKTIEYGEDHWQLMSYKTILPSDGMKINVSCYDDLIIKQHMIFDNEKNYNCYISEDKTKLEIYTSQWISPGNGMNILIGNK